MTTMQTTETMIKSEETILKILQEEFVEIAFQWAKIRKKTGEHLIKAMEALNTSGFKSHQKWLENNFRFPKCDQNICMKVAQGLITEEQARWLPASTACKIDPENFPKLDEEYAIYSVLDGRIVKKRAIDFTKEDKRINVSTQGILSAAEAKRANENNKPLLTALAKEHRIENTMLVLYVPSIKKEIKYKITQRLIDDINSANI